MDGYEVVTQGCGLVDRSEAGKLALTGSQAAEMLDGLVTNDVGALQPGSLGPFFEVRDYLLKPGMLAGTIERWQQALPKRLERSPILAAMYSISGQTPRWVHIWPYKSLDERHHVRTKATADGIWPPPGGGAATLETMRNTIFVPATFSPIR